MRYDAGCSFFFFGFGGRGRFDGTILKDMGGARGPCLEGMEEALQLHNSVAKFKG